MNVLGIETSCDETSAAIVENGTKILSNIVSSSLKLHIKTGGIVPEVASREQVKFIIPVIEEVTENSGLKIENLDAIAVTIGPGLIGSLLVGVETAKTLAYIWQKPIIPVNHLIGHIYGDWLGNQNKVIFPAIVLLASGGHTDLVLMKAHSRLKWLGGTRDDAAGEAFDKIARLLGFPYPGGPSIAAAAEKLKIENLKLKIGGKRPEIVGRFNNFLKAILTARKIAEQGDIILLSPGCTSFGMFENEFDRGEKFEKIVNSLA